tara:strand:+ start:1680 stop:2282 length:603 start_codon:yes stop_codon:yes gene_type:complete
MYTGIVAGKAPVTRIVEGDEIRTITLDLSGFDEGLEIGASVALDGVCMTVVNIESSNVGFDAIAETLTRTTLCDRVEGDMLNVERSLRLGDELGGHMVSGHVMCTAEIIERAEAGEGLDLKVATSSETRTYILEKGFIAVDGMSLTVGRVDEGGFYLHIIPETLRSTTIGEKSVGDWVNIEIDSGTKAIIDSLDLSRGAD